MPSALIVEDETLLAKRLRSKLARLWPELEIAGMVIGGDEAVALAAKTQPDVAFVDIRLPGMSGLEVAAALPAHTKVVFVTAHDEFAVEAFRAAAVDYLLKPVSDKRLAATIGRLRAGGDQDRDALLKLLAQVRAAAAQPHLQWIRAGLGDTTLLVSVDEVIYFRADNKYTSVVTAEREHLVRKGIGELEAQLDPDRFWRIHRGVIVRVDQIASASRDLRGRYVLKLRDHGERLRSSRAYAHLFKHM